MKTELKKNNRPQQGRRFQEYLQITPKNRMMIEEFLESTAGEVHPHRHANYERFLWLFANVIECDFDKLNEEVDGKLTTESRLLMKKASRIINDSDYSDETIRCLVATVKVAFKHWYGDGVFQPLVLKFLKRPKAKHGSIRRRIFSEDEIVEMIEHTTDPMWRFFLAYLGLDSGARPCELRRLTWGQLEKDQYGYYFQITTAKDASDGASRPVRILKSAPYFLRWQREKRRKNTTETKKNGPDDFVFLNQYGEKLTDTAVAIFFSRLRKRMRLDELTALSLRRSWITRKMCDPRITTAQIQAIVGQTVGGNAIRAYTFIQDRDILNTQLHLNGRAPAEDLSREIALTDCPKCQQPNAPNEEFCAQCRAVLVDPAFVTITEQRVEETERLQRIMYEQCRQLSVALEKKDIPVLQAFATAYSSLLQKDSGSSIVSPASASIPTTTVAGVGPAATHSSRSPVAIETTGLGPLPSTPR